MELVNFIRAIQSTGDIIVDNGRIDFSEEDENVQKELALLYRLSLEHCPNNVPSFSLNGAFWGAKTLYQLTQFLLIRDANEQEVEQGLTLWNGEITDDVIFSVDLLLRYLPQIHYLAKDLSPDDILVKKIEQFSHQFPMSSIGIELNGEENLDRILDHSTFRVMYVDRVIATKAKDRLNKEKVRDLVQGTIGKRKSIWSEFETLMLSYTDE